jgi:hypothetical protein
LNLLVSEATTSVALVEVAAIAVKERCGVYQYTMRILLRPLQARPQVHNRLRAMVFPTFV